MAEKVDDDAVAAAFILLFISILQIETKRKKNVIKMYLHQFCTIYRHAK